MTSKTLLMALKGFRRAGGCPETIWLAPEDVAAIKKEHEKYILNQDKAENKNICTGMSVSWIDLIVARECIMPGTICFIERRVPL